MDALKNRDDSSAVLEGIDAYLKTYGHQGYSMDFVEPTQIEDPSALFATLKGMVPRRELPSEESGDPRRQGARREVRRNRPAARWPVVWQFRFRLWLARRYNYIREEVAFHFGYTWSVLRPMVKELGRRMTEGRHVPAAGRRLLPRYRGTAACNRCA